MVKNNMRFFGAFVKLIYVRNGRTNEADHYTRDFEKVELEFVILLTLQLPA